jgi:putative SbcD/Mre11-related phosphoesterase
VTKAYPINPHAALILEYIDKRENKKKIFIVVSDLHLGFESSLIQKGINIDSNQIVNDILDEINEIRKLRTIDGIIILGDLKSSITHITKIEWDIVPYFLDKLSKDLDVFLIPGNHDGNIDLLVPESVVTCNTTGLIIDDTLLIHGHTLPNKIKSNINKIIMGHLHPIFIDPKSTVHGKRVWIYLKVKKEILYGLKKKGILEIIIIPTFNKYFYSTLVSTHKFKNSRSSPSPIINLFLEQNAILSGMLFTLEGSVIGDVKTEKFH